MDNNTATTNKFKVHTLDSAPQGSKQMLEESIAGFGMLPNLHGVMAESPALLEAYKTVHGLFMKGTSFNNDELTVIWQAINVENGCHYCVPAHTAIAGMMKVDEAITEALRNNTALPNEKLEALRNMTLTIMRDRGNVSEDKLNNFLAAGYESKHVLEIILGLAQKTMSNYVNHFAQTPVDEPFQKFAWNS